MSKLERINKSDMIRIGLSRRAPYIVTYGVVQYLKGKDSLRALLAAIGLIGVAIFFVNNFHIVQIPVTGITGFLIMGIFLLWLTVISGARFDVYIREEEAAEERRDAQEQYIAEPTPFSALELDAKRLNEYYVINQSQARGSFLWAVFAMLAGLSTIIAGVWLFYLREGSRDAFITSLSTAAGLVVNAISVLFLHLHNKTQARSIYYYERLFKLQQLMIAIKLAEAQTNEKTREEAMNKVIDYLLRGAVSPIEKGTVADVVADRT